MDQSETIRTFIGIPFPEEVSESLIRLQERLRGGISNERIVKFERKQNFHITLQFLGDTPKSELLEIRNTLENVVAQIPSFTISFAKPDVFGGKKPRVFVVNIDQGTDSLVKIQSELAFQLKKIGFKPDKRPYHPHVTVARIRRNKRLSPREASLLVKQNDEVTQGIQCEISEVVHFESELTPTGAIYSRIETIELGA